MSVARGAALLLVAVMTASCATLGAPDAPPPASADVQEQTLLTRIAVLDDPAVAALLARVTLTLLTDAERAGTIPDVVVVKDPTLSAFVLPSGRIYVHTGVLARLENEAQLATMLARGITLARLGAALERQAGEDRVSDALLAMPATMGAALSSGDVSGALLSATAHAILGSRLTVVHEAAVTGYGRALEADADAGALRRLVRAGYDPKEAPRAFERLRREAKTGGPIERFFLGREAALTERVDTLARLVASDYVVAAAMPDTIRTTDDFDETIASVARENARLELGIGRFRAAQEQLDHALAVWPADAAAHLAYGDLHRLRAQRARGAADRDELARRALAAYEQAARLDPDIAEVARQIGLLYYQQGRLEQAREAFTRYITRNPDAPDAPRVREYLATLSR